MAPILKVNVKLPKPQTLRQRLDRDCGVPVFGKLVGVTYEEVLSELPSAHLGITVWMNGCVGSKTRDSTLLNGWDV